MEKPTPDNQNNLEQTKTDEFSGFIKESQGVFHVFVDYSEEKISREEARTIFSEFLKKSQQYSVSDMENLFKEVLVRSKDPSDVLGNRLFYSLSLLTRRYESEAAAAKELAKKIVVSVRGVMRSINQDIEQFEASGEKTRDARNQLLRINQEILEFFSGAHAELDDTHFADSREDFLNSFKHHYQAVLSEEENINSSLYFSLLNKVATIDGSQNQNEVVSLLIPRLDEELRVVATPVTDDGFWQRRAQEFLVEATQLSPKDERIKQKCFSYTDTLLARYNLKTEDIFNPWFSNEEVRDFIIKGHLERMNELEDIRPGAVKILFDEFGITLFNKYPLEVLRDQFDQRNSDMEYGIFATTQEGSHTALSVEEKFSNYDFLKQNNVGLRCFEFKNVFGLLKGLKKLDVRYGNKHKISFTILNAHGGDDGKTMALGGSQQRTIDEKDLTPERVSALKSFFSENPHFLFLSCETGKEDGIAESFSKMSNAVVVAPKISINSKEGEILFVKEDGNLIPRPVEENKELFSTFRKKD